jgi:hypothetical protein
MLGLEVGKRRKRPQVNQSSLSETAKRSASGWEGSMDDHSRAARDDPPYYENNLAREYQRWQYESYRCDYAERFV